jgi:REP element-mobilizing transposase RayT
MSELPDRETSRLRFGRTTAPEASYFVTACTKDRVSILNTADIGRKVSDSFQRLHSSGDISLIAATIMPDHVHFLFTLGYRLRIGQVLGKFKALARDLGQVPWHWQQDGFEHRLRNIESIEDYGFYIFMNPYRAGLCPLTAPWPWWLCPQPSVFQFLSALDQKQVVPAAWLGLGNQIAARIIIGNDSM